MGSGSRKSILVVGGPGSASPSNSTDVGAEITPDVPCPDVTNDGNVSVDGSVSLESTKQSIQDVEDDDSENSEEDSSSEEEEEEEEQDELPDFLKSDGGEEVDPEEAKALYEAAKFKAASILSVSEDKLTDVQMLQAIAIAEVAARNGDEKFSTRRSLFKLNEAKIDDLKTFLNIRGSQNSPRQNRAEPVQGRERVRWGIGRGRFIKKVGSLVKDFKDKCEVLDENKKNERRGKPTDAEVLVNAASDIKKQIEEEFEKIAQQQAVHLSKLQPPRQNGG